MVRTLRGIAAPVTALAVMSLFAGRSEAQYVVPAPVVTYYGPPAVVTYSPPPRVSYYSAPRVSYYAPAPVVTYSPPVVYPATAVTTYRYGAILPRRRVTVTTYTPTYSYYPPVYYGR